jgi:uncharacterized membrane protein (DUF2068 family)
MSGSAVRNRAAGLYTIIAVKAGKGLLLLLLSLGIFSLVGDNLRHELEDLLRGISLNPEREFWTALGQDLETIAPESIRWLASGTLLYALLLFVESFGLVLRTFWAAWLAIGETAFFIPIEIFDLVRRPTLVVFGILILNLLIVVYLVRNRERLFHHHQHRPALRATRSADSPSGDPHD